MAITLHVKAEILPQYCLENEITGKLQYHFHYRGLDMVAENRELSFVASAEELGDLPSYFQNTAFIHSIDFKYN